MVVFKASRFILNGCTPGPSKSLSQRLLINNGFIHPIGKGLYSLLPLGQRVVDKIARIIDQELESIGALKVSMPIIAPRELWERTGRWSSMGAEMMHMTDRNNSEMCLQPTAEEMCTQIVAQLPPCKKTAYPLMIYQTTDKFRDEMNPRFGLMRARQFLMKDLYTYDLDEESARNTYNIVTNAYERILRDRLQLDIFKVNADSGVHGGKLSHEFHLRNALEEDGIHFCDICQTGRKLDEVPSLPTCEKCTDCDHLTFSTIEIAHTFQLGNRYSTALKAQHAGKPLEMCCFGIGVTRLLPAAVEALSPSCGSVIRLPKAIAPFDVAVVISKSMEGNVFVDLTLSSLTNLLKGGILLDDRVDQNIGKRLKELNNLGIPRVVVLGKVTEKSMNATPRVEVLLSEAHSNDLRKHGELTLNELMQQFGYS